MGFIEDQDRDPAAFGVLAREQVHGLGAEGGVGGPGDSASAAAAASLMLDTDGRVIQMRVWREGYVRPRGNWTTSRPV